MTGLPNISGGYATGPVPPGASGDKFHTQYTIIATDDESLERLQLTFCDFNEPRKLRFFQESFNVVWKKYTEESIKVSKFFHPLQDFSGFQNQTFVIKPESYFYFDPGYFGSTNDQIGFLFASAEYLPEAPIDQRSLYWTYGASGADDQDQETYAMGDFLSLSGAIREGATGNAWNSKGFYFTNPNVNPVKLKIITAN